jgi:hypothetical protein
MPPSLEHQQQVATWREQARAGTLSMEDMKKAIAFLRGERLAMAPAKAKKAIIDTASLFSELENL